MTDQPQKAVCDRCGFEYLARQLRKEPLGSLRVCHGPGTNDCWEPRHPQELIRGKADRQTPPWVRPEPPDVFEVTRTWNETTFTWDLPE